MGLFAAPVISDHSLSNEPLYLQIELEGTWKYGLFSVSIPLLCPKDLGLDLHFEKEPPDPSSTKTTISTAQKTQGPVCHHPKSP